MSVEFLEIEELFTDLQAAVQNIALKHVRDVVLEPYDLPAGGDEGKAAVVPIFSSDDTAAFISEGSDEELARDPHIDEDRVDHADGVALKVNIWTTADAWGMTVEGDVPFSCQYDNDLSSEEALRVVEQFSEEFSADLVYTVDEDALYDLAWGEPRVAVMTAELAPLFTKLYNLDYTYVTPQAEYSEVE